MSPRRAPKVPYRQANAVHYTNFFRSTEPIATIGERLHREREDSLRIEQSVLSRGVSALVRDRHLVGLSAQFGPP
jgi:hypothetical protein